LLLEGFYDKNIKSTFFDVIWPTILNLFVACDAAKITAEFIGEKNLCPANSTLYERSTGPMKVCVPVFTPPDLWVVIPAFNEGPVIG
jgi:hypothetical protein